MRIVVALIAGLLAGGLLAAAGFATPSFDCARATARDEQRICADPGLAQLDDVMAAALTEVQGLRGAALRPYELMLLENRQACGGRADCIAEAQRYAIEAYGALGAKGAGAPGQFFRHTGMPAVLRAWHRADGECRGATVPAAVEAACRLRDTLLEPILVETGLCQGRERLSGTPPEGLSPVSGHWLPCVYDDLVE